MLRSLAAAVLVAFLLGPPPARAADDQLVIHEWGTFTSLVNENGQTLAGVNTDDEPVPAFVHDISGKRLVSCRPRARDDFSKGFSFSGPHPQITMRLETPVLYFYPPKGSPVLDVDVEVQFTGGWLSQFYPGATAEAPGADTAKGRYELSPRTVGKLTWKGLRVGGNPGSAYDILPDTRDPVWLAPRLAHGALVTTADGKEAEEFLFYRGVGALTPTITVVRRTVDEPDRLEIRNGPDGSAGFPLIASPPAYRTLLSQGDPEYSDFAAWWVNIRADGALVFRGLRARSMSPEIAGGSPGSSIADIAWTAIKDADFTAEALPRLRSQMKQAMIGQGLFAEEAEAMLTTWEASYFKAPGQRIFYLVPQKWTDRVMPLKVSAPAKIRRVMVARVELVTPRQRKLMEKLDGSASPETAAAYQELGRFREPLALDQQQRQPTDSLNAFIKRQGLGWYKVKE